MTDQSNARDEPVPSTEDTPHRLAPRPAQGPRLRYVVLLLGAGTVGALVASLWATEPHPLPGATRVAFAVIIAVAVCCGALAGWVLRHRRPLYAKDRVLTGWLAVTATSVMTAGTVSIGLARGHATATVVAGVLGTVLIAVASGVLVSARRRRDTLPRRASEPRHRPG